MRRRRGKRWLWVVFLAHGSYPAEPAPIPHHTCRWGAPGHNERQRSADVDDNADDEHARTWIGVVLISSQCHQRKQQGAKGNFYPSIFVCPICLAALCCKVWMANVAAPFLHLTAKEEERCLHSVLTVWLSVWEKGR